jgi:alpha-1,6-mannosyltransferase
VPALTSSGWARQGADERDPVGGRLVAPDRESRGGKAGRHPPGRETPLAGHARAESPAIRVPDPGETVHLQRGGSVFEGDATTQGAHGQRPANGLAGRAHRVRLLALTGAGIALSTACWGLARVPNLVLAPRAFLVLFTLAFLAYGCGALAAFRLRGRLALPVILTIGAAARLLLLPVAPSLSTDAYRYVWDARLASAGVDPYAYPPAAPEIAGLRDSSIYPKLNHPTWHTVYPPPAQAFFRAVYRIAPDSVTAMKVAVGIAELLALAALVPLLRTLDLPAGRLAIYAWNPLLLVEIWGSGHLDALVLATVTGAALASARRRDRLAATLLAVGALIKLYPAVLFLLLPGRRRASVAVLFASVVIAGTIATGGLDHWPVTPIARYVRDEYFNPGLVRSLVDEPRLALAATAAWVVANAWRGNAGPLAARAAHLVAGVVVLAPNVFPWYAVWLVPFLAVTPSVPLLAFTGTVVLAYSFFLSEPWTIPLWARLAEGAPLGIAAALKLRAVAAGTRCAPGGTGGE